MATKKVAEKEDVVDYEEICEIYELLLGKKNREINCLTEQNKMLKKSIKGTNRFASKQQVTIENYKKELQHLLSEKTAEKFLRMNADERLHEMLKKVISLKYDRLALVVLSLILASVIIFVQ